MTASRVQAGSGSDDGMRAGEGSHVGLSPNYRARPAHEPDGAMMVPLPHGPFGVILADPPWSFRTYGGKQTAPTRRTVGPYDTMSLEAIKALPVERVAAKNAVLVLWTVSHLQSAAFDIAAAWGFKPVSVAFVWDKGRMGMGYWTRQEVEICHLFKRGRPPRLSKGVRQKIVAPRREHSRKPDEQYERIEALASGPYLEIFARQSRQGWSTWGNEATKFDQVAA